SNLFKAFPREWTLLVVTWLGAICCRRSVERDDLIQKVMAGTLVNLRNTKVLVIDDNPHALEIISQVLVGFGIAGTQRCDSAPSAERYIQSIQYDLIMTDAEMVNEAGLDFTRFIRSRPSAYNFSTPIIVTTGCPTLEKTATARDNGANFVLAKPIVPQTLMDRILWIARHTRPFVASETYAGPDRRFRNVPLPEGLEDRREETRRLIAEPTRAMAQDEIDSLF
ncbi:MAG: response regulator, partial [Caulobacterales bacterium]